PGSPRHGRTPARPARSAYLAAASVAAGPRRAARDRRATRRYDTHRHGRHQRKVFGNPDRGIAADEIHPDPGGSPLPSRRGGSRHRSAGGGLMSQAAMSGPTPRVAGRVTDTPATRKLGRGAVRPILMLGGILVVAAATAGYWITGGRIVSIDNAYVRAAKEVIATDVSGIVTEVPVHEGQAVKKGDVLLRLDTRPFEIALAGARANRDGMVS